MQAEIEQHLELEIEEQVRRGVPPAEARRNALVAFGGVERFKEDARDARGVRVLEDAWRDLAYALRTLRKQKGYTLAATGILTVGVAGTIIVTSAVNYLLFRAPPIDRPDEVVIITERWRSNGWWNSTFGTWVYPYEHYRDLRGATGDFFTDVAGFRHEMLSLYASDQVRSINGGIASPNYFVLLNLRPALGRFFVEFAERRSRFEVVLSHDLWTSEFGSSPDVLGRILYLDSRPHEIVGVAPEGFHSLIGILHADVWIPADTFDEPPAVTLVGRLRPGVTRGRAAAALAPIVENLPSTPALGEINLVELDPVRGVPTMMRDFAVGFSGLLAGAVALVLFIGLSNLSALMLARATHRRREVSVRLAMGASRVRVVRQLLVENFTLCVIGATTGSVLAWWLVQTVPPKIVPPLFGITVSFPFDALTWGAGLVAALIAAVGSGVTPVLDGTRLDLATALRGREDDRPRRRALLRTGIVGAQLAISVLLLLMAGLFVQVLRRSLDVDPGFVADNVAIASIQLEAHGYDESQGWELITRTLERLQGQPDVVAATAARWAPLSGSTHGGSVVPVAGPDNASPIGIYFGAVDVSFFETMGVRVIAGRPFTLGDMQGPAARVAVVNETLARRLAGDASPLGTQFRLDGEVWEVVGVAGNGRYVSLDESPRAYAFLPLESDRASSATFFVRTRSGAASGLAALRQSLAVADPNIALEFPGDFAERLRIFVLPQQMALWFIGTFGLIGMALAAMGIYGAVGYQVAQRTREFGIRIALGAQHSDVVWHVVRRTAITTSVAVLVGAALAFGITSQVRRILQNQFIFDAGVSPWSFVGISVFLAAVALFAAWLPARRAAKVDPMTAIRVD